MADEAGGFSVVALGKQVQTLRGRFAGRASQVISVRDMNGAALTVAVRAK